MAKTKNQIYNAFYEAVNMTPVELEEWLKTDESKRVGSDSGDGESIGHKSGKKIISIKGTLKENLSEEHYDHMKQVVGFIHRHKSQRPKGNVEDTNWRYSLKNWGYDPCK